MPEHHEHEMPTEEVLLRDDIKDTFQREADTLAIGFVRSDGRPIAAEVLSGLVSDTDLIAPVLTLFRVRSSHGEHVILKIIHGPDGGKESAYFVLRPPTMDSSPRPSDETFEVLRDVINSTSWDKTLSETAAENLDAFPDFFTEAPPA